MIKDKDEQDTYWLLKHSMNRSLENSDRKIPYLIGFGILNASICMSFISFTVWHRIFDKLIRRISFNWSIDKIKRVEHRIDHSLEEKKPEVKPMVGFCVS